MRRKRAKDHFTTGAKVYNFVIWKLFENSVRFTLKKGSFYTLHRFTFDTCKVL
jgi:hypothetical protein